VISGQVRPTRRMEVVLRRSGGETILYDTAHDSVHLVNDTAAAIWELCDGETQKDEIVVAICQLTGMLPDIVEEDVDRLMQEFVDAGLVVLEGEPA
jgi:hypothetical protein